MAKELARLIITRFAISSTPNPKMKKTTKTPRHEESRTGLILVTWRLGGLIDSVLEP
jgi:hypothetical protein